MAQEQQQINGVDMEAYGDFKKRHATRTPTEFAKVMHRTDPENGFELEWLSDDPDIVEWVRKRGNTITDDEGNHFVNMVATCYDENMQVARAAKLLSDWVTTNDNQHTEWDEDPHSPLERQIMLFDKD